MFFGIESQRQRHRQQHSEAVRCALHAQHHTLKLKPVSEWRAVERQFVRKRNELETGPCCSVSRVERLDASITTCEKVLPQTPGEMCGEEFVSTTNSSQSLCALRRFEDRVATRRREDV